jgi:phage gp36-like protein
MAYIARTELPIYGASSGVLQDVPTSVQDQVCAAVSDFMDGYFDQQFVLPLVEWGRDVKECAAKIAIYDLLSIRGFSPDTQADVNIRMRREDAVVWLKLVSEGKISPRVTDSSPEDPSHDADTSRAWSPIVKKSGSLRGF